MWRLRSRLLGCYLWFLFISIEFLARAAQPGDVDTRFNPAFRAVETVRAIALQSDGRILFAAYLDSATGGRRGKLYLVSPDGLVIDLNLDLAAPVWKIVVQFDDKIVIAGAFPGIPTENGTVRRGGISRLNADGTLDRSFDPGEGAVGESNGFFGPERVTALAVDQEGRCIIAGCSQRWAACRGCNWRG